MRRVASFARRAGRRLLKATARPKRRGPKPIALSVVDEAQILAPVPDGLGVEPQGSGVVGPLAGRPGPWSAARVENVWYVPAFGAVMDPQGRVFRSPMRQALPLTPPLAALPGARQRGVETLFTPPSDAPLVARGTVFVTWAGLHNYGHFLVDCLPALHAVLDAGGLERFPAIAPPLLPWQRDLLRLMLGDDAPSPLEIDAPVARLGEAVFTLGAPGASLQAVRERVLLNEGLAHRADTPRRLYVSRRGAVRRQLLNEIELEAALTARGFAIVDPDRLSVREQIALFHGAEMIVSQSGAALTNVLFCRSGARVVEIQTADRQNAWARDIARLAGADWSAFIEASPPIETEVLLAAHLRPDTAFSWRLDLDAFLAFLERTS